MLSATRQGEDDIKNSQNRTMRTPPWQGSAAEPLCQTRPQSDLAALPLTPCLRVDGKVWVLSKDHKILLPKANGVLIYIENFWHIQANLNSENAVLSALRDSSICASISCLRVAAESTASASCEVTDSEASRRLQGGGNNK